MRVVLAPSGASPIACFVANGRIARPRLPAPCGCQPSKPGPQRRAPPHVGLRAIQTEKAPTIAATRSVGVRLRFTAPEAEKSCRPIRISRMGDTTYQTWVDFASRPARLRAIASVVVSGRWVERIDRFCIGFEALVERGPADPQNLAGLSFVAVDLFQHIADVSPLGFGQAD